MSEIRALREVETWTGGSIFAAVVIGLLLVALLAWLVYRYLRD